MPAKTYFSYVRVSTQRQGSFGTSLAEQLAAIERYAGRFNLPIVKRYEERETAAKQGRPVFLAMLKALRQSRADGLIVHKIDRSARNLKDWADLGALIDSGIEVHFANESLDLNSRGGRLSADIQAVVAADYIRNLREETKKGIYGRLRQGLYPFPARVGYLNAGKGEAKRIDPVQAPLVRRAFELYASGDIGLNALVEKMYDLGLRNKGGGKISRNGLVCILKNPFYLGLIKIEKTSEMFAGVHPPLVSKTLFEAVQGVFAGKRVAKKLRHFFVFRRLISCRLCRRLLVAERQKGNVYYRCQTKFCAQKCVREEMVEKKMLEIYEKLQFTKEEYECLKEEAENYLKEEPKRDEEVKKQLVMELAQTETRLAKLADAYVDEVFDKETYFIKKNELLLKQQAIKEKLRQKNGDYAKAVDELNKFLELVKSVYLSYQSADASEKREMVQITVSNFWAEQKIVLIKLSLPFQIIAERPKFPVGSPHLATTRTFRQLHLKLLRYFKSQAIDKNAEDGLPLSP